MTENGGYEADAKRDFAMPVEACYHCWRLPDPDGDHTCPCPKRDGECPEHDPVTTFAEYQRRYLPDTYQRARVAALTPEQAARYTMRLAVRKISDDIFARRMGARHRELCGITSLAFGGGCRHGWSTCPTFLESLTDVERQQISDISDPERWCR